MAEMTDRAGSTAEQMGQQAQNSDWLDKAIRVGLICYGVVHLLIGWLALQLAFGDHSGKASDKGAMQELAEQPYRRGAGLGDRHRHVLPGALAAPRGAASATRRKDDSDRWKARAVSLRQGRHLRRRRDHRPQRGHRLRRVGRRPLGHQTVMDWPAGQWIVAAVGLAVIVYGANHVRKGFTEKYAKHLDAEGKTGQTGKAYSDVRQGRLHRQGHRHRHRRRADHLRRHHPRRAASPATSTRRCTRC